MRETTLAHSARRLSAPIIAELAHLLGRPSWSFDDVDLHEDAEIEDDDFIADVWQEVGDDLRNAMRQHPVAQAEADAGKALPASAA